MSPGRRATAPALSALCLIAAGTWAGAQGTQSPRPGLTAQQTKQAVEIARGAMVELRKKTEGASKPEVDRREYVVAVELLRTDEKGDGERAVTPEDQTKDKEQTRTKEKDNGKARRPGPLAVVTSYRYFDDITVFATVDLGTGRVVDLQAAQHLRTALSAEEFEEAKVLARDQSEPVKALYQRFGDKLSVYPQFSQYTAKDDPRVHRVVHLTYRVGTRDLSYPRPVIDLTTRRVVTPEPEAEPRPRPRRPGP
jgi:Cu2+-containing amine oxidase